MPTITISGEPGQQITVTVNGGQPVPVQSAEEACAIIEQTFGGAPEGEEQAGPLADQAMQAGFNQARPSLGGQGM